MKNKSIRYYLITSITVVLIVCTLVMGLIQTYTATTFFRQEKEALLGKITASIAEGARQGHFLADHEMQDTVRYIAEVTGAVVVLCAPNGQVRFAAGQGAPAPGGAVATGTLEAVDEDGYDTLGDVGGLFSNRYYANGRLLRNDEGVSIGYVFAAADASGRQTFLTNTMTSFILSAALALLLSSLLALGLTNRTILPIKRINEAARRFTEGDYSVRVPVQGDDELAQLAVAFNNMAASFQATDASRRSFMGNIAHELRTPMTSIKGFIDGMLDGTIPADQRDRYLTVVGDEVGRLARLTRNMLDVSRLEAGEYTPNLTAFDLWEPLTSVFLGFERQLEEKNLRVEGLDHGQPALVQADADFVHQVLYNLVDNAIKFAAEGGTVSVQMTASKGSVALAIRNTGEGIPGDALPHVFDRFYKADLSRGVNARGAGLGLHISKVLLGLMGGRIWVDSEPGEWTEFAFSLPAADARRPRRGEANGAQ